MSENVINIQIKASRRLRYLVMLMHLLAVSAVCMANLPIQIKLLLVIILMFSAGYYWSAMLRSKGDNELLQYSKLEGWRLSAGDQPLQPIELQQCFISRPLVIINFQQADKCQTRLILGDSAEHDALRKLRILLHQTA